MRGLFWLLALFGLAVCGSVGQLNQGYVLLVLPWRVDVSLNLFIVIAILSFALFYAVLRALPDLQIAGAGQGLPPASKREQAAAVFQGCGAALVRGRFGQALKRAADAYARQDGAWAGCPGGGSCGPAHGRARAPAGVAGKGPGRRSPLRGGGAHAGSGNAQRSPSLRPGGSHAGTMQLSHGRHLAAMRLELRALQGTGTGKGAASGPAAGETRRLGGRGRSPDQGPGHLEILAAHRADAGQWCPA